MSIPKFIMIKPRNQELSYVSYKDGFAVNEGEGAFSPLAKIEVEIDAKHASYIHLRFFHSNKYLGRSSKSEFVVAESKKAEDDTSFKATNYDGAGPGVYYFTHVQSSLRLQLNDKGDRVEFRADTSSTPAGAALFNVVDWDSLVKLPQTVAFKGDNDRYLKGHLFNGLHYLQFDARDPNAELARHEVELLPSGYVKIKCLYFSGSYWRNGRNWVLADPSDASTTDEQILFWPVRVDDTTIALRSELNNNFCKRLYNTPIVNCLSASSSTITAFARLVVQELVMERKIFNVRYRMEDARIFNEKPYVAGSTSAVNESGTEDSVAVTFGYTATNSYSFSNSTSLTAGVAATIEAEVLEIIRDDSIQFSSHVSESLEWGKTKSIERTVTATGTVIVPARSKAVVDYVGTLGSCNVPFSYKRQDQSSTDGKIVYSDEIDGFYTGFNAYDFRFRVMKHEPL